MEPTSRERTPSRGLLPHGRHVTEPLFAVWVSTEGLPLCPILCTDGDHATSLLVDLASHRIITDGALVPCCRNDQNTACTRDTMYEPGELDRPTEVLMRAAMARGITWPADLGQPEPEYSVLFDD